MSLRLFSCALILACTTGSPVASIVVEANSPAIGAGQLTESIGIETLGGLFTPLLEAGCSVPCEVTKTFGTAADRQTEISVHLVRGNAATAEQNYALGRFAVVGIPKRPRGEVQVSLTLRAEVSGITLLAREASGAPVRLVREP